jgi:hypothetical protein
MKQTHTISIVIDDEDPIEKQRHEARIAARSLYDFVTGDADRRVELYKQMAEVLHDGKKVEELLAEQRRARLCQSE